MSYDTLATGSYLGLYARGQWEYAARTNCTGAVAILPLTDDNQLILVEQFRVPLQQRVIEIPAGLAGDEAGFEHESLSDTAQRELLEETGYLASEMIPLFHGPTSPGMTTEMVHFFAATGIRREHAGGGTEHEDIVVHQVPLSGFNGWVADKQSEGLLIDCKIHACLYLAYQRGIIKA